MISPVALLGCALICIGTAVTLKGGWRLSGKVTIVPPDTPSAIIMIALIAATSWFLNVMFGIALFAAILLHEFGLVIAHRALGYDTLHFRVFPVSDQKKITDKRISSPAERAFIYLMGPAIGLAPMAVAFTLVPIVARIDVFLANFLYIFGSVLCAVNALALLPIWPLDGGRIVHALFSARWPPIAYLMGVATCALLVILAISMRSVLIGGLALIAANTVIRSDSAPHPADSITPYVMINGALAYVFTLIAFSFGARALLPLIL